MATPMLGYSVEFSLFVVISVLSFLVGKSAQDIVGCGGFLKSSVAIDFSKVEIKLYTKQGTLKESSDCAPTNGYYFIPIYDKGEYVLKIEPPSEWFFEPKEVPFNFNGVDDPCSKGKDINFAFKGFTLRGKVTSAGAPDGPENIKVILVSDADKTVKFTTTTGAGGQFQFAPILPQRYLLTATHDKYKFQKDSASVVVTEVKSQVPDGSLVIAGYDVTGQVQFNNEPTVGVNFVLSANDVTPLPNFKHSDYLCHVTSDEKGTFRYEALPSGSYTVRPYYGKFDVQPKEINIVVRHDHLVLSEKFLVKGFSVSGRVLMSEGGPGLKNAEVSLNGKRVASTDKDGRYTLDSVEPGNYVLSIRAENVKFDDVTIKLSPNTPEVTSVYPSEFKVCGQVTSASGQQSRTVEFQQDVDGRKATETTTTDRETGKFCKFLKTGQYSLSVKLTDMEKSSGIHYLPLVKDIHVRNSPISDIEFTQLRGTIQGRVVKLPESGKAVELSIKLKLKNSLVAMKILEGNDLTYTFDDVMPGFYDVEVDNNLWCFQNQVHSISVTSTKTTVPDFLQTGFKIKIRSSHATEAMVTNNSPEKEFSQMLNLDRGENYHCLPHSSPYKLILLGCHGYEKDSYMIDPTQGNVINLVAVSHDVTGFIKCPTMETDLTVDVILPNGQSARIGPLKGEKEGDDFIHRFKYRIRENQSLKFIPLSSSLLFRPETIEYRTINDCSNDVVQFIGEKGLIVEGKINPPLSNVKVTLNVGDGHTGPEDNRVFLTKADGKYKFGPLRSTTRFEITAEKESYVLTGPDKNGVFKAHKLAEINVKVIDSATKEPLQGVLLSLTGGEKYRKNSMTEEGGFLSFHSLSPGEYFIRPMMKEYKFEPSSQIIQIKEGVTESIELRGRRVSFSAYGTVASLNGEPEGNVVIEAVGINTCSNLVEEASSEPTGQFRIRGLLPQCDYQIRLKNSPDANTRIHRLEPQDLKVKTNKGDVRGLELIAFHLVSQMDLSVHVDSTTPEHLKTVKLKLCKEGEPDSPVYAVRLDTLAGGAKHWGNTASQERFLKAGLLVHLPFIPRDKTPYFIQLESSLNRHTYSFKESTVHFVADKTFRNFKMSFDPVLKTLDHELSQSNYIVIPVLIFAAVFYTYFHRILPVLQNVFGSLNQASFSFASREERNFYSHNNVMDVMDNVSIEPVHISTKRKLKPRKT
ncbi:hypothetical protein RUM44_002455 [Polyplax serrata]|uniref:Nodal modulator 1 n=1 Tax=Polyplax serrata TaxID=468196 RepID=A0ABR1AEX7_POLSC